ncbi:MAG TPA: response regulator transcription factor [Chloroflexia bacterium]|jgi:DNA-binding NarL/FixJ family response regulator|nr:response regulator transcription factor [Chloroflexia bacterium]
MTRVFIAALTPMLRAGLRTMLAGAELEVLGETAYLAGDLDLAEADVLLVADESLLGNLAQVLSGSRRPAVVALADDAGPAATLRALDLPGWAILPRDAPMDELQTTVLAAAHGLVALPVALAERMLSQPAPVEALNPTPLDEPLTPREREVLDLLAEGLSNKLIARRLQISEHTVKFHVSSIYAKLSASSRTEAVSQGARRGLITL